MILINGFDRSFEGGISILVEKGMSVTGEYEGFGWVYGYPEEGLENDDGWGAIEWGQDPDISILQKVIDFEKEFYKLILQDE